MIAGDDEHRNPRCFNRLELGGQRFVALPRAVERQIAGENQRLRMAVDDLRNKRIHQFFAVHHGLAVGVFDKFGEIRAVVGQRRGDIVHIRRRPNLGGGFAKAARGKQNQAQEQQDFHSDNLPDSVS